MHLHQMHIEVSECICMLGRPGTSHAYPFFLELSSKMLLTYSFTHWQLRYHHENRSRLSIDYLTRFLQQCYLIFQTSGALLNLLICGLNFPFCLCVAYLFFWLQICMTDCDNITNEAHYGQFC